MCIIISFLEFANFIHIQVAGSTSKYVWVQLTIVAIDQFNFLFKYHKKGKRNKFNSKCPMSVED